MTAIPSPEQLITIGRVQSPYGIKGWVWVYANTEPMTNIFGYMPWYVQIGKEWREVQAVEWREQGKGLVARFKDCHDRNAAEALHGAVIWTAKTNFCSADLDSPPDDVRAADRAVGGIYKCR